jgi:hypothetical protein
MKDFFRREARLLIALLVLVVLMNVPYGHYVLYPFKLFSTWVHEMSHGLAALALGGEFESLKVYADGSGLAYTRRPDARLATAFVASAGYTGTAFMGMVLLLARRLPKVGRVGTAALGALMLLSMVFWVRNVFGLAAVGVIGAVLLAVGLKAKDEIADLVFAFLAATCSLNAITSIRTLFSSNLVVNGQSVGGSDATTVADALLLPSAFWAAAWMVLAFAVTAVGLRFPLGKDKRQPTNA